MSRAKAKWWSSLGKQRGFAVLTGILALLLLVALVMLLVLDHRVTRQFEGRKWTLPARVYAQPIELYVGQSLPIERMTQELTRLGYRATDSADRPGTFHRKGNRLEVHVREFRFSDAVEPARLPRIPFPTSTPMATPLLLSGPSGIPASRAL